MVSNINSVLSFWKLETYINNCITISTEFHKFNKNNFKRTVFKIFYCSLSVLQLDSSLLSTVVVSLWSCVVIWRKFQQPWTWSKKKVMTSYRYIFYTEIWSQNLICHQKGSKPIRCLCLFVLIFRKTIGVVVLPHSSWKCWQKQPRIVQRTPNGRQNVCCCKYCKYNAISYVKFSVLTQEDAKTAAVI